VRWRAFITWLSVPVVLALLLAGLAAGVGAFADPSLTLSPAFRAALVIGGLVMLAWCLRGAALVSGGEESRPTKSAQVLVITIAAVLGVDALALATAGRLDSAISFVEAVIGVWLLSWICAASIGVARAVLAHGSAVIGAARAVLDEALRLRVAVVFMVLLMAALPLLPLLIAADQPLRYRLQSFLSYSLSATGMLLSLMTIFLSCATLSREIEDKQIYTVATKPIGRVAYLLGKWLGILVLDAVLLIVSCAAIYGFTVFYMARQPAMDVLDRAAVRGEVLTARVAMDPKPGVPLEQRIRTRLEQMMREDPKAVEDLGRAALAEQGLGGASREKLLDEGAKAAASRVATEVAGNWMSVAPGKTETFVFDDLAAAKQRGQSVQLQYRLRVVASGEVNAEVPMIIGVNGQEMPIKLVSNLRQSIDINPARISKDGKLVVTFTNPDAKQTVTFDEDKGLEVLYEVDGFGPNFTRAALVMWVKLAFLAMLGLAAATCLGFPIACLLSLLVYVTAVAAPFLFMAIADDSVMSEGLAGKFGWLSRQLGLGFTTLVSAYSQYDTTDRIVRGMLISWSEVAMAVAWIGVGWTVVTGTVGSLIFRSRELARVQV
jgi:ABC-type transport system involved in multi-copper enzyme maturation permease subunit